MDKVVKSSAQAVPHSASMHFLAIVISFGILTVIIIAGVSYASALELKYIHALAPLRAPVTMTGIALQRVAFSQPDLLPVYGASEAYSQGSEFQEDQFFKNYPTGFAPYANTHSAGASIIYAEALAAVGSTDLRGKKVVISFTPSQFNVQMMDTAAYANQFSRLQAYEVALNTSLSYGVKQQLAQRMLQYPDTLKSDALLRFTLEQLASDSTLSRVRYYLVYLLDRLQLLILELQDHYQTVAYITSLKNLTPALPHQPEAIDWNAKLAVAIKEQIPNSNNNLYGFDNTYWNSIATAFRAQPIPKGDAEYLKFVNRSLEWSDLELVLRILNEAGAQPLLIGRPTNKLYYHAIGISDDALAHYYDKLDQLAAKYNVAVVDFKNFQDTMFFGTDAAPHTSRIGWVYVDQALDNFYHAAAH